MASGSKWVKMVSCGARLKYIKYFIKLIQSKKSKQNNSNKNKLNSSEIIEQKIKRNKFGFPTIELNKNK